MSVGKSADPSIREYRTAALKAIASALSRQGTKVDEKSNVGLKNWGKLQ